MAIFGNKSEGNRQPTERSVIQKAVIVDLWVDEERSKINWSLSRVNPANERGYRTLRPENLPEAVLALAALGRVFSGFAGLTAVQQKYFAELSVELDDAIGRLGSFETPPSGEGNSSGFLSMEQR